MLCGYKVCEEAGNRMAGDGRLAQRAYCISMHGRSDRPHARGLSPLRSGAAIGREQRGGARGVDAGNEGVVRGDDGESEREGRCLSARIVRVPFTPNIPFSTRLPNPEHARLQRRSGGVVVDRPRVGPCAPADAARQPLSH